LQPSLKGTLFYLRNRFRKNSITVFAMNNITIRELAEKLKLSVGTVSKALKDSYEISEDTKRRVREMAIELNYIPNLYASSLKKRKSKTIAVVIPEVADSFFSLAINGIESVAEAKGYHVLIYLTHESFLREQNILHEFKSGRVDGILISVSGETTGSEHITGLLENNIPVVFFDRITDDAKTTKVITDDFNSGYLAAQHLIDNGCKKITYLSISKSLSICNRRMEGFEKALSDNNILPREEDILFCSNNETDNLKAIIDLLSSGYTPDGLIISVEKLIIPVYQACCTLQLNIPGDIKLIGFSNLAASFILNPSLTTITQPAFEMGKAAATLLFNAFEKSNFILANESIIIPSQLNVRDSSRAKI